jgi:hypothetical protein
MILPDFVGMPYERVLNEVNLISPKPHIVLIESRVPIRKRSEGDGFSTQMRVIRQRHLDENGSLELTIAAFLKDPVMEK